MISRIKNKLRFQVEQLLLRGAYARLLFIASLVGVVAITGGIVVQATDTPFDDNKSAVWWAFLRLTDPGYLGDDEGMARRAVSSVLTVLGYVLFMGSLIAIMTQWLNQKIREFERGLAPIVRRNHILILGWTNRTPAIVEELMHAEGRVRRFLRRRGARNLHIVILAEDVSLERTIELRRMLGDNWDAGKITFRSGTPLRLQHLERVDYLHASAIILPGADFAYGGADESDTRTVKTLVSIAKHADQSSHESLPLLVTEIFDPHKVPMAQETYRGNLEVLASDIFIARCMVQNVRHPGLSSVFHEILSHGHGNTIFMREFEESAGSRFGDLAVSSPNAIPLGVVRSQGENFRPLLNPPHELELEPADRLVFLARTYEDCQVTINGSSRQLRKECRDFGLEHLRNKRRILILGWNHKVADVLKEFERYIHERFDVAILSFVPVADRETELKRKSIDGHRVALTHYEGDYTSPTELAATQPGDYDNVMFLGSDRLETQEESDARTIMGHLVLRNALEGLHQKPKILVDLMDGENVELFDDMDTEVLVSPTMASHVLAQVALRRELNVVYEELFGAGGAEIFLRRVSDYGVSGKVIAFEQLKEKSEQCGEIVLGARTLTHGLRLNPQPDDACILGELDDLVVLVAENTS